MSSLISTPHIPLVSRFSPATSTDDDEGDPPGEGEGTPSGLSRLRPGLVRQTTDNILSYYRSPDAGRTYVPDGAESPPTSPLQIRQTPGSPSSVYSDQSIEAVPARPSLPASNMNSTAVVAPGGVVRRPSVPSDKGMDKRRVAIVQMDAAASHASARSPSIRGPRDLPTSPTSNNLLSRRGHDSQMHGFALVAPPDASPTAFMNLTPPTTGPPDVAMRMTPSRASPEKGMISPPISNRGASEATPTAAVRQKSSRDTGSGGLGVGGFTAHSLPNQASAVPAIFQTPINLQTATPPPSAPPDVDATPTRMRFQPRPAPLTPEIGQQKDVQVPVAGPIVIGLSPGQAWLPASNPSSQASSPGSSPAMASPAAPLSPTHASSYLLYQPGIHATAGPLPPPPRALFEIDTKAPAPPRPPRVGSPPPPKSPHRTRFEVPKPAPPPALPTAAVPSPPAKPAPLTRGLSDFSISAMSASDDESPPSREKTSGKAPHVREGAFSPSLMTPSSSGSPSLPITSPETPAEPAAGPGPTAKHPITPATPDSFASGPPAINEPEPRAALEVPRRRSMRARHTREPSTLSDTTSHSSADAIPASLSRVTSRGESSEGGGGAARAVKSVITQWKRFSALPRTPSAASLSHSVGSSRQSAASARPSRTPSPNTLPAIPVAPAKVRAHWPEAMQFDDVLARKTALERAMGYAQKINELAMYECGLEDWVVSTKTKVRKSPLPLIDENYPRHPSGQTTESQDRVTSDGSVRTQATFPIRPDAYVATDLGVKLSDVQSAPATAPPTLPYPALAKPIRSAPPLSVAFSTGSQTSARSIPLSLPSAAKSAGGFFSSLGRRSSAKKEQRPLLTPSAPRAALTKPAPAPAAPRPVKPPPPAPVIPGGPRAPPNRVQRSQTLMTTPAPPPQKSPSPPPSTKRRSSVLRRPSVFTSRSGGSGGAASDAEANASPDFQRQVDKLADLLPHVEKSILAGYLRRAGQDILAIGQYLEDEKNGTVRRS